MDLPANVEKCRCESCSGDQCDIGLTGMASEVDVLDLDCIGPIIRHQGEIADCIIWWKEKNLAAVVELKGGQDITVKGLVRQIQGGLDALERLTEGQPVDDFIPILMYRAKRDPTSALNRRDNKVQFRGRPRFIIARPCGFELAAIISENRGLRLRVSG